MFLLFLQCDICFFFRTVTTVRHFVLLRAVAIVWYFFYWVWYLNCPRQCGMFLLFLQCDICFFFRTVTTVRHFVLFRAVAIVWYFFYWVVNFLSIYSIIPAAPGYGVYITQLQRYSRACGCSNDFIDRGLQLTRKLLNQGFLLVKLKSSLRRFYVRHHDLVDRYGISVSQMTTDMSPLSLALAGPFLIHDLSSGSYID
jgi:hypothetical protein